ncbi:TrlF family AAA-like ATPase [Staphylococcus equorum]|uniref:TrlF family AAA-like ATPase n=1 Tax=Staphylococcus equorum TaxID=246432 RepID=UPI003F79CE96
MSKSYAEFYKCALQVNPYSYIEYRGFTHEMTEEQYNESIYHHCIKNNISIVGLADHGDVHSSYNLRSYLVSKGLLVFPGFEISTSEKIHLVCLFSEKTEERQLDRYLGELGLTAIEDGISPSTMSFHEITQKVLDRGGFWYAAHITSDNGILKEKSNHLWKSDKLISAQIPSKRDEVAPNYINILKNKDPNYKKQSPYALINAKDISKPEDLDLDTASCLIKMSELNFESFKLAFKDPETRVKLNYDINEKYPHSSIDEIKIFMGYLDNLSLNISPNLNTIIGGRGAGKSTLIELIRYALDISPISNNANSSFTQICDSNLGLGGRIELLVTSHEQYGKQFKIVKRYNQETIVKDTNGLISHYTVSDILPNIEIYSQNEIIDLTTNESAQLKILNRFLTSNDEKIKDFQNRLQDNAKLLLKHEKELEKLQNKINKLPKLREKIEQFNDLGISKKLETQGQISTEEQYIKTVHENIEKHNVSVSQISTPFKDSYKKDTKHVETFDKIDAILKKHNDKLSDLLSTFNELKKITQDEINEVCNEWEEKKKDTEKEINLAIKSLDDTEGKTKQEISNEYSDTLAQITSIAPLETQIEQVNIQVEQVKTERNQLIEELQNLYDDKLDNLNRSVKKINNNYLKGLVNIKINPYSNVNKLLKFLKEENGLGDVSLKWIQEHPNFDLSKLIQLIKNRDSEILYNEYKDYGLQKTKADILSNMTFERVLHLEIIELDNIIDIQLNIGDSTNSNFKSLNKLSKGQQCTAILNILTLKNNDPLLVDQPEDNLDNSFITNNLIHSIRQLKINRQFVFATHNANIPVFGDAELIAVMETEEGQGIINKENLGSIDNELVRNSVIRILEGGNTAFQMRKNKYGL